jgi:O-acetyl-ADP-ribose deacetylase (regulator of RNase III)
VKNHLVRALAEPFPISTSESVIPSVIEIPDQIFELRSDDPIAVPLGRGGSVACVLHAGPIDQLENVDIIVVSENVYLQMAHFFKPSISGRIRLAAARRAEGGEILEDIAQRELDDWVRRNGKLGLPLPRGAVASTSPGALASQGVSRLFHRESHSNFVKPETIGVAVHRIFELARQERERFPDLRSICLPLLGAGRGGLDASTSFNLIWEAAKRELEREPELWELHFIAWRADQIQLIRGRLTEKIVIDVESSTEEARTDA